MSGGKDGFIILLANNIIFVVGIRIGGNCGSIDECGHDGKALNVN